jgi:ABC-type polysaccharide/polyol phosphate export permease
VIDAPGPARRPVEDRSVRIVSARPSLYRRLLAIWNSRELLYYFIITDIKIKYKSSVLGLLWSLLAPALTLGIYDLVFGTILRNGIPNFVIYLTSGLLIWNFFFNIVSSSTGIIVERAAIVKKVAFPREILALSTVGTSMIYFVLQATVMSGLMLVLQHSPDWTLMWLLPISIVGLALVAGALGIVLSAINVYLRDTKHLVDVFLQLWFYLTPIVYSFKAKVSLPLHQHGVLWLYMLNPVTPFVMTFQRVLFATEVANSTVKPFAPLKLLPSWPVSTYLLLNFGWILFGCVAMVVAVFIFGRLEGNFAEEL